MNYKRLLINILSILIFTSCSIEENGSINNDNIDSNKKTTVSISAVQSFGDGPSLSLSKTTIDKDYATTRWNKDDEIYIWATPEGSSSFTINNVPFGVHYYGTTFNNAIFTGTVNEMSSGEYTYYGVYPKPKSIDGTTVTYNISSEQNGKYDGVNDVMVAEPTDGDALVSKPSDDLNLVFKHLTHLIRIEIPSGRNHLGDDIKKLVIDFPQNVVGSISFNLLDGGANTTYNNTSKSITLTFDEPLSEGEEYIWLFVNPTTLKGEINFTGYANNGHISSNICTSIDKKLEAGNVTPIKLTIPEELSYTTLSLSMSANNLGEDYNKVTFTAPEGASFRNGKTSITFAKNSTDKYTLEYYHTLHGANFKSKGIACEFDSDNAIVNNTLAISSSIKDGGSNDVKFEVPYLFYEDFSGVNKDFSIHDNMKNGADAGDGIDGSYESVTQLKDYGMQDGWTAIRVGGSKTHKSIRVAGREEAGYKYPGRLDSPQLKTIKSGKSVKVSVSFNYSGGKNEWKQFPGEYGSPRFSYGYDTRAKPGNNDLEHTIASNQDQGDSGSYNSITKNKTYTIASCSSSVRLSWRATCNKQTGVWAVLQNGNYWLYIDNVKVKIAK